MKDNNKLLGTDSKYKYAMAPSYSLLKKGKANLLHAFGYKLYDIIKQGRYI